MVKLNVAAPEVPLFVMITEEPAAPVVTVPRVMVAADPVEPVAPVAPVSPRGIVKLNIAALDVPTLTTEAALPAEPVVVVPTATVPATPWFTQAAGVDQVGVVAFAELIIAMLA
jgi:hypothetical protein